MLLKEYYQRLGSSSPVLHFSPHTTQILINFLITGNPKVFNSSYMIAICQHVPYLFIKERRNHLAEFDVERLQKKSIPVHRLC